MAQRLGAGFSNEARRAVTLPTHAQRKPRQQRWRYKVGCYDSPAYHLFYANSTAATQVVQRVRRQLLHPRCSLLPLRRRPALVPLALHIRIQVLLRIDTRRPCCHAVLVPPLQLLLPWRGIQLRRRRRVLRRRHVLALPLALHQCLSSTGSHK